MHAKHCAQLSYTAWNTTVLIISSQPNPNPQPPDNHHSSDAVCRSGGEGGLMKYTA